MGGTFNPPHLGHLIIAQEVQNQLNFDEIWFMPNQQPPHKENQDGISSFHRAEMVKRAILGNHQFKIQTIELERSGRSYTFDTMMLLTEKYNHDFYFIIGADMVEYLPKWYKIDELIKIVKFVGVNRPKYDKTTDFPIININVPNIEISSQMIRSKIKEGESIRYFVPDTVKEYIEENRLYEA